MSREHAGRGHACILCPQRQGRGSRGGGGGAIAPPQLLVSMGWICLCPPPKFWQSLAYQHFCPPPQEKNRSRAPACTKAWKKRSMGASGGSGGGGGVDRGNPPPELNCPDPPLGIVNVQGGCLSISWGGGDDVTRAMSKEELNSCCQCLHVPGTPPLREILYPRLGAYTTISSYKKKYAYMQIPVGCTTSSPRANSHVDLHCA